MKTCVFFAAAVLMVAGCGKNAASIGSTHDALFQSADPQVKAQWDAAMAAIKTNGYAEAILALKRVQTASLSPEQREAVDATATTISDQMYDAANKGVPSGVEAIEKLRQSGTR